MTPESPDAASVAPSVDASTGTVTYRGVWQNVDLRYTVTATGVKEDLILVGAPAVAEFTFSTSGAVLGEDRSAGLGGNPGGLVTDGVGAVRIAPPLVTGADGRDVSLDAKPVIVTDRGVVAAGPRPGAASEKPAVPAPADLSMAPSSGDIAPLPADDSGSADGRGRSAEELGVSTPGLGPAAAEAGPSAGAVMVAVDATWLGSLGKDAFPVTVDPTMVVGSPTWTAYASNGYSCSYPCGVRVGNSVYGGNLYWRSLSYHPYESLIDNHQKVVSATVNMTRYNGTSNANPVYVCWASAWSFNGACSSGYVASGTLNNNLDLDVTDLYRGWVDAGTRGGTLGFAGNDAPGLFTYKELAVTVTIVYNTPPKKAPLSAPADKAVLSTLTPTLTISNPGADADGDSSLIAFTVATGGDGISGAVTASYLQGYVDPGGILRDQNGNPVTSLSWTVDDDTTLKDGQTYYWRVSTYDGINLTYSDVRSFKIDMRLGAGGPSPTDPTGPVLVNLATGNASTTMSTPKFPTVGGSIGLDLTYNSQAPAPAGLTGAYQWDSNTNKTFDEDVKMSRVDPQIDFDWGSGAPSASVGSEHFLARWTGYVNAPTGNWDFGVVSDDGVRLWVDNMSSAKVDSWVDQGAGSVLWASTGVSFSGSAKAIKLEYYENTGSAVIRLVARPHGTTDTPFSVPSSWLSPEAPPVPGGWTMSVGDGTVAYTSARISDSAVVLTATDGSAWEYTKTVGAGGVVSYKPPAGIDDVMITNLDGSLSVYGADGNTYWFDTSGHIVQVGSVRDDRQPAATTYTWTGTPARLTEMGDPVSGRSVTLTYGGGSCPSASGFSGAPSGMLCKVAYWDGTQTDYLYNANGQIARVVNPGGSISDLAYDGSGQLTTVRSPLANDAIAAGVRSGTDTTLTTDIAYSGDKVMSVTAPAPVPSALRPQRSYTYGSGTTTIATAGITGTASVSFDSENRHTGSSDATNRTTAKTWDDADRLTSVTDAAGVKTSTIYDTHGWVTDIYGPAPAGSFPSGLLVGDGTVAHSTTDYDEPYQGLAATYYDNTVLTGAPKRHSTALDPSGGLDVDWGATPPYGLPSAWGLRLTGDITLSAVGTYTFGGYFKSGARLFIDDTLVVNSWTDPGSAWTLATGGTFDNPTANSVHRIRIDLTNTTGDSGLKVLMAAPGGSFAATPASILKPRYGLPTRTTDASGRISEAIYSSFNGIGPEFGLPTLVVRDPGMSNLNLETTTFYEAPSSSSYLRRTGRWLPAGSATEVDYSYYGASNSVSPPGACSSASAAVQGGRLRLTTDADPDGAGGGLGRMEHEVFYDAAGRVAAARTGVSGGGGWVCTTYDSRGRTSSVTYPAYGVDPGRTVTYDYAVGGDPLVTRVSDPAGDITTEVDLLGRVVSYTDALGVETVKTYDQAGRVTTATAGTSPAMSYEYDDAGRVAMVRINGQDLAVPGYDTAGRLSNVSYPSGTGTTGNGTEGTFTYDANGRAESIAWDDASSGLLTSDAITARDASGRITDQSVDGTDPYPSGLNYDYDAAGRLTTAHVAGHAYTYNYDAANPSDCTGVTSLSATGKNTNRTSMVDTPSVGSPTTFEYCYDNADRLTKSSDTAVGTPDYDDHGNATELFGEDLGYDYSNRHLETISGGTTVEYVRDATDRIITRKLNGNIVAKYAHSAGGDTPSLTLDASGTIVEQTLVLPGGVMLTIRSGGNVWSYPNIHGDYVATADQAGAKQGATATFDPYGNLTSGAVADNSAGSMDYGWLGQHQRPLEQQSGLEPTIEMGARQYSPRLGRFIEQDPVEAGSANDYDYTSGDPINRADVSGRCPECAMLALISALIETQRKGYMRFDDSIKIIKETQARSDHIARSVRSRDREDFEQPTAPAPPSPAKVGNPDSSPLMPTNEMINDSVGYVGPKVDGIGEEMGPGCALSGVGLIAGTFATAMSTATPAVNVIAYGALGSSAVGWKQSCP